MKTGITNMSRPILRAYKFRFYPTSVQELLLSKTFGCIRQIWNIKVAAFNFGTTKVGPDLSGCTIKQLKDIYPYLSEVPYNALEQKLQDWSMFRSQYFNKSRKTKLGRPKFKKRGGHDSFRLSTNGFKIKDGQFIELAKIGRIAAVIDRPFISERTKQVKSCTVSRNAANQYFVSILVEEEMEVRVQTNRSIGIDLGLTDLFIFSDGTKVSNPRYFRENQSKLARNQRHMSRKVVGSGRYERQRQKVARIHADIKNQRSWLHHNVSRWLVDNYDVICVESLNVAGMKKGLNFGKSISDAGWSSMMGMLKYKSDWAGRSLVGIDRFYPSSKTCSSCDFKMTKMDLSVRNWTCLGCGVDHDRDINAAKNIRNRGLKDLYSFTSGELLEHILGEDVRPKLDGIHPVMAALMKRRDPDILDTKVSN